MGELSTGVASASSNIPIAISTGELDSGETFRSISGGYNQVCGISNLGNSYCWGYGLDGQLGHGSAADKYSPAIIDTSNMTSGELFLEVDSGDGAEATCGLTTLGKLYCWGNDWDCVLGDGGTCPGSDIFLLPTSTVDPTL